MSYSVLLHPKAAEFLRKLDEDLKDRIRKALKELKESPEKKGERLQSTRFFRIRIGDYRAIYQIDRNERKVIVLFIGHRRDVYDDFSRLL